MKKLLAIAVLACSVSPVFGQSSKDSVKVDLDTIKVTAPAGAPAYRGATPRIWDIINTRVALSFDMKAKTAAAKEWVKLKPYAYSTDTILLDAKSMKIDSVCIVTKKGLEPVKHSYANDQLKITFGKKYTATDTLMLYFRYTAMPYAEASEGSRAITDDKGLYFINTDNKIPHKPAQIWTQGETESNSHWMITVDKPNTRFTTQIELTVPDSFVTLSNGALMKQTKGTGGMRTDMWKMDMPIQAYAVMFAIGKFAIVKDHWKNKEVSYYVEPQFEKYASQMFKHTPEMMQYFSERTGVAYPWNKYNQVVVRDYVSGAMENTTASLFGEFMNQNFREMADKDWEDVVSHELFHQWFGDYATCESWSNLTVNESFANYGEQLWRSHKYGKVAGDELAWNDLQGYLGSSSMKDPALVRFYYDNREEMFDAISYNKGGAILHYLNTLLGDAMFDRAMNIYLTKNALHSTEAHNWRMAVEEATGQDWNWFFNQWYFRGGHPAVRVYDNYNDTTQKLTVVVNQTQTDSTYMYDMPMKTAVIYGKEKTIIDWRITKKTDTFTFDYHNGVAPVVVADYEHVLPGELKEIKKPAQWLVQFTQTDDYVSRKLALNAAGKQMSDSSSQAIIDLALANSMNSIRRGALSQLKNASSEKYRRRWTPKVTGLAAHDSNNLVRAEAMEVLGEWKVNNARSVMVAALGDSSYAIAGAALEALDKIDKDTAYIAARAIIAHPQHGVLESAIWSVIGKKGADADGQLYAERVPYKLGTAKFTMAFSMNSYLKNVQSDAAFSSVLDVYTTMILNESMKGYRASLYGSMFQLVSELKAKASGDDKAAAEKAKHKVEELKTAAQKLAAAEPDPENGKDLKKLMKENFENDK